MGKPLAQSFYPKKTTFTLGFSLNKNPSGNLQPFGGKSNLVDSYSSENMIQTCRWEQRKFLKQGLGFGWVCELRFSQKWTKESNTEK